MPARQPLGGLKTGPTQTLLNSHSGAKCQPRALTGLLQLSKQPKQLMVGYQVLMDAFRGYDSPTR